MSSAPIALIIGAGSNVGLSCARAFSAKGYQVLLSSRKARSEEDMLKYPHFPIDLTSPTSVVDLFQEVKKSTGIPSVVVYNGWCPSVPSTS